MRETVSPVKPMTGIEAQIPLLPPTEKLTRFNDDEVGARART
jgi:hypothetical protein